jgi:hypothetical protein
MSASLPAPRRAESERLERLQARFAAGILGPGRAVLADVEPRAPLDAGERFGVYVEAYRARLRDALRDTYGHTARHLGQAAFGELAREYIETHAPEHYSIRWYGGRFPAWLRAARPRDAHVAELAALDWALRCAFDSADAEPLGAADLAALAAEDWERIGFVLHPAFQLLEMDYNTVALWHALDREEPPPPSQKLPRTAALLVWRRELQPCFRSIESDEADALRALHDGASFGAICARLAESAPHEDATALAGQWLARWIADALLVAVR